MGGSLNENEINELKQRNIKFQNFIETGTYKGETTFLTSKYFENVYTIEIAPHLFNEVSSYAKEQNITNVHFYLGDSLEKLDEIMKEVENQHNVFFLDAHISGYDSSWNQIIRVPLLNELDIILSYDCSKSSVFIFDDVRLWKTIKAFDWIHITNEIILNKFYSKNIQVKCFYEKDDRFYVFTK